MRLNLDQVIVNARQNGCARRFPREGDPRIRDGAVFSRVEPRFQLEKGSSIFTLGSCFARSIEEQLQGFALPASSFSASAGERPGRPNGILNEYNPGSMCQRVEYAVKGETFGDCCIAPEGGGFIDLLLPEYVIPATRERLMERRSQVEQLYAALPACDAVIATLDQVEAWFDNASGLYLNRVPHTSFLLTNRDRFELRILDVCETQLLLERMVNALLSTGVKKIILSVSPIPLEGTYSGQDCVVANTYSKSVLLVSANHLSRKYVEVNYFPGYEIVMSAGPTTFEADSIHVRDDMMRVVTGYLIEQYAKGCA